MGKGRTKAANTVSTKVSNGYVKFRDLINLIFFWICFDMIRKKNIFLEINITV